MEERGRTRFRLRRGSVSGTITAEGGQTVDGRGFRYWWGRHDGGLDPDVGGGEHAADKGDGPVGARPPFKSVRVGNEVELMLCRQSDTLGNVEQDATLLREAGPVVHLKEISYTVRSTPGKK